MLLARRKHVQVDWSGLHRNCVQNILRMAKGLKSAYRPLFAIKKIDCITRGYYCPVLMRADFTCQLRPAFGQLGRSATVAIETVPCEIEYVGINYAAGSQNNSFRRARCIISSELSACSIHLSRCVVG